MMKGLEFNELELESFMKETRINDIEKCIEGLISFTRFKQKEYEHGGDTVSGHEVLSKFHQDGFIKTNTYLKLRQLIDNPKLDYIIIIK